MRQSVLSVSTALSARSLSVVVALSAHPSLPFTSTVCFSLHAESVAALLLQQSVAALSFALAKAEEEAETTR